MGMENAHLQVLTTVLLLGCVSVASAFTVVQSVPVPNVTAYGQVRGSCSELTLNQVCM